MPRITIDTSDVRQCEGCQARAPTPLYRHHKGHDKLIGMFNRKIKKGYYKWLHCVLLCDRCHLWIHWYMELKVLALSRITTFNARRIRKKLIAACDEWLKMKPTDRPTPSKDYVEHWETSHADWLARQKKTES